MVSWDCTLCGQTHALTVVLALHSNFPSTFARVNSLNEAKVMTTYFLCREIMRDNRPLRLARQLPDLKEILRLLLIGPFPLPPFFSKMGRMLMSFEVLP